MLKKLMCVIFVFALVLSICGCKDNTAPTPSVPDSGSEQSQGISVTVEVVAENYGVSEKFVYDELDENATLDKVLVDNGVVNPNYGDYGLYFDTACGITADASKEEWWGIYVNDAMASTGASGITVSDGATYRLELITGYDNFS